MHPRKATALLSYPSITAAPGYQKHRGIGESDRDMLQTIPCVLLHFSDHRNFFHLMSGALLSFAVASADEGIQMLTGRGDQVADVLIDVCGYLSAYLLGVLILYFVFWRSRREETSEIPCEEEKTVKESVHA